MAEGRQKAEWIRGASLTANLLNAWGSKLTPWELVPRQFRDRAPVERRKKTPAELESDNKVAWTMLDGYFGVNRWTADADEDES